MHSEIAFEVTMKKTGTVVFVMIAMGGAACTPRYVQPTSGPTAQVRVNLVNSEIFSMVHTFDNPGCADPKAIGLIGGPKFVLAEKDPERVRPQMLGSKQVPDPHIIEILVPAEKPFTVLYTQIGPHSYDYVRTCKLPITFLPRSGAQYEVTYSYGDKKCFAKVGQLSLGSDGKVASLPLESVTKESDACKHGVLP